MLEKITKTLSKAEYIITRITAILIILLTIFVSWQAFARYVLNTGQFWAEEVSIVTMMWICFLGASGGVWTHSHIGLKFFIERLPYTLHKLINIVNNLIIATFSLLLFYYGIVLVKKTMSGTLSATKIPIGYSYLIIPISTAFMTIFSLYKIIRNIIEIYQNNKIHPRG